MSDGDQITFNAEVVADRGSSVINKGEINNTFSDEYKISWDDVRAELAALDLSEKKLLDAQLNVEKLEDIAAEEKETQKNISMAKEALSALSEYGPNVARIASMAVTGNFPGAFVEIINLAEKFLK